MTILKTPCISVVGGQTASQPPPLVSGKSLRFVRACVRAVSVMSFRGEKLRREGCIFHVCPVEVVSFISWEYLVFRILVNVFLIHFLTRVSQERFPREISKIVSQERFPREIPKRDFHWRLPRYFPKGDFQEIFPREISKREF